MHQDVLWDPRLLALLWTFWLNLTTLQLRHSHSEWMPKPESCHHCLFLFVLLAHPALCSRGFTNAPQLKSRNAAGCQGSASGAPLKREAKAGPGLVLAPPKSGTAVGIVGEWTIPVTPPPPCDIPSGCCSFTGPWTVPGALALAGDPPPPPRRANDRVDRRVQTIQRMTRSLVDNVAFPMPHSPDLVLPAELFPANPVSRNDRSRVRLHRQRTNGGDS